MAKRYQKGESLLEGLLAIGIIGFIIIAFVIPGKSPSPLIRQDTGNYSGNSSDSTSGYYYNDNLSENSIYSRSISIGVGNASRSYQPYEEYITIENRGRDSINITGWTLKNAKDERTYELGGRIQHFPADTAVVGRGARFISPYGESVVQNIVLGPGEKAIVTTGSMAQLSPYRITSFKENVCSGYLGELRNYSFEPALRRDCPNPEIELGVRNLDTKCQNYIDRLRSCETPDYDKRDRDGEICSNCADGVQLSSSCINYLKGHYSYSGCIANHAGDPNFEGDTWRIFLGQKWEMWANDHDIIKLFDSTGNLVDYKSY